MPLARRGAKRCRGEHEREAELGGDIVGGRYVRESAGGSDGSADPNRPDAVRVDTVLAYELLQRMNGLLIMCSRWVPLKTCFADQPALSTLSLLIPNLDLKFPKK